MSVNKVIILGRLGQDPELKYTPNGNAVCNFSLATSESWNDKATGQKQERTEWHRVVVWGKLAELCNQYLSKGRQAFVEGQLQTRSWDDDQGNKKYSTEINAKTVQFIGGQTDAGQSQSQGQPQNNAQQGQRPQGQRPQGQPQQQAPQQNYQQGYQAPAQDFASDDIPF